jgi:hypothetical protein
MKTQQNYFTGGKYTCDYHPKTKIPIISCIMHIPNKTSPITTTKTFAQQLRVKGCKRVTVNETNNTAEPITYVDHKTRLVYPSFQELKNGLLGMPI